MDTAKILTIIQLVVAVLMTVVILVQNKGVGLSQTFGGGGDGNLYQTKRGAEKILFRATIVLVVLFLGLSVANLFVE
ncbi:preprotein translocase subunit SecG [Patescibacteria group bacterium]|nr:preprotein translocase subunit SecG [Patescibacteria group bacterium]